MPAPCLKSPTSSPAAGWAPLAIAVGFAILLAGAWWSSAPVVTAMALIALGATGTTVNRSHSACTFHIVVALHLFVYLNLYFLFVGAVCHASTQAAPGGFNLLRALDLGMSVVPMALVMRGSLAAMIGGRDAPAR